MSESITGFLEGNIEQWASMLMAQTPRIAQLLFKTIDPVICGSLIELLGNSTRFKKKLGTIAPVIHNNQTEAFQVRLVYQAPDFIGYIGDKDPILEDTRYILKRLQQIPGIAWNERTIQLVPKDGTITVSFIIPVGYSQ